MYTEYFGFAEKPFKLKADPLVFYVNPGYEKAYNEIGRGIHEQHGPIVLTGAAGTGKTSLLHICMAGAEEQIRFVVFAQTTLSFSDILDHLSSELGLTGSSPDETGKSAAIMDFLAHHLPGDTALVLVIDDAHNLDQDTIDKLLGLYQSQAPDKRRLQILLIGLPELKHKFHYHQIGVRCQLEPLADSEISAFIEQQLHKAGCHRDDLFPAAAVQRIAAYAKGVPRHITALCDAALLNASLTERQTITPEIVEQAAQHCFLSDVNPATGQTDDTIEYITPADVAQVFEQTSPPRITEEPAATPATEQTPTASDTDHHQPGASLIERLHADSPVSLGAEPPQESAAHPEPTSTAVALPSQPAVGERPLPAATETAIDAPKDGAAAPIEPLPSARQTRFKTRRRRRRFPKKLLIVFLLLLAGAGAAAVYKKPEWFGLERAQIIAAYSRAQEYAQKALAKTRAWIEQFQDTIVQSSDSPAPGQTQEPAQLTPSTVEPEPEPAPTPQPEPELSVQPEPEPAPAPPPAPAPQPGSTPAPEPEPRAAPEPALAPAPEPAPQAGPEPAPAPQPEPPFQPEPAPQIQPEPTPESQAEPEPQSRPASTPLLPEQSPAPEKESAMVSDAKVEPLTTLPTIAETPDPVTTEPEELAQQQTEQITEETAALGEPAGERQTPVPEALFARAEQQLSAQRLTTPSGDNALETYLEILDLSPDNDRALAGIEAIKNTYRQWADRAAREQAWGKARDYYEKALSLDPDDNELKQALQQLPR